LTSLNKTFEIAAQDHGIRRDVLDISLRSMSRKIMASGHDVLGIALRLMPRKITVFRP
jgi:hypothetical protein